MMTAIEASIQKSGPSPDAPVVEAIKLLSVRPNDVVVVKVKDDISNERASEWADRLREYIGMHVKVLVLRKGAEIEILRHE